LRADERGVVGDRQPAPRVTDRTAFAIERP